MSLFAQDQQLCRPKLKLDCCRHDPFKYTDPTCLYDKLLPMPECRNVKCLVLTINGSYKAYLLFLKAHTMSPATVTIENTESAVAVYCGSCIGKSPAFKWAAICVSTSFVTMWSYT